MAKEAKYKFKRPQSQAFTLIDEDKHEAGSIKVEPNRVGWRPAGETRWYYLPIKDFANLAIHQGVRGGAE